MIKVDTMNKPMTHHEPTIQAIWHGLLGGSFTFSTLGLSMLQVDEWTARVSLWVGILVGILTAISIIRKLMKK